MGRSLGSWISKPIVGYKPTSYCLQDWPLIHWDDIFLTSWIKMINLLMRRSVCQWLLSRIWNSWNIFSDILACDKILSIQLTSSNIPSWDTDLNQPDKSLPTTLLSSLKSALPHISNKLKHCGHFYWFTSELGRLLKKRVFEKKNNIFFWLDWQTIGVVRVVATKKKGWWIILFLSEWRN